MLNKIIKTYPIFRNRNFRLYFYGQLISFAGNWLQNVAQGWLVLEITHSAYWVGVIYALPLFVGGAFAPIAGTIADKFNKKKLLCWVQILGLAQAFLLGILTITHHANLEIIGILAFGLGIITAVDGATRNVYVAEIVDHEQIGSAAALNGALQTASQVVGPGLGGFLIALFGTGWTFIINGLSFIPVLIFILMIQVRHVAEKPVGHPFRLFVSGIKYTLADSRILLCVLMGGFIPMFGYSFRAILPTIATLVLHAGPQVLGYLASAAGLGACIGSLIISAKSKERLALKLFIVGGSLLSATALVLFSFVSDHLYLALIFLFLAGTGFTLAYSSIRAETQMLPEGIMRGRVSGIAMMIFFLGQALGNYLAGLLADKFGVNFSILFNGIALLLISVIAYMLIPKIYAKPKAELSQI